MRRRCARGGLFSGKKGRFLVFPRVYLDDEGVPCFNSFVLAEAYARAGVPCELHVFEHGDHGLSTCSFDVLADDHAPERAKRVAAWLPMCFDFLKDKGFCPHKIK